jgi:hypothetical protein
VAQTENPRSTLRGSAPPSPAPLTNRSAARARRYRRLALAIERAETAPAADLVEIAAQLADVLPAGSLAIIVAEHGLVAVARSSADFLKLTARAGDGGVDDAA